MSCARQLPIRGAQLFRSKFLNACSLSLVRCYEQLPGETVNVGNNGEVELCVSDDHDELQGLFDVFTVQF